MATAALVLLTVLSGCGTDSPTLSVPDTATAATPVESTSPPNEGTPAITLSQAAPDFLITPQQIGPIKAGMTLGEIKRVLGDRVQYRPQENFMVDFSAIAVIRDGETQFYLMYYAADPIGDRDEVPLVWVDNPNFQTAEGVGPGTTIRQASQVYGAATLSYSYSDEMREYVRFERGPDNLLFRSNPQSEAEMFAGIYDSEPPPESEFFTTQQYREGVQLTAIIIPLERAIAP